MELTTKFTLVGINFSSLDGADAVPVNEIISGNFSDGDELQIQDTQGGYTVLTWKNGAWYGLSSPEPATVSIKRGLGAWVVSKVATEETPVSIQLKGAVNLSDSLTVDFGQQYVIAATGLPVDAAVNSTLFTWENLAANDQLQIPDGMGGYTVLEWQDKNADGIYNWYGVSSPDPATAIIPKESAIWIVSTNQDAKVTIHPNELQQ